MAISIRIYERADLAGVIALCRQQGWPSFPADPERAHRSDDSPRGDHCRRRRRGGRRRVVGFACLQSDGEIQAHLSLIAVDAARRRGIARALIAEGLARAGGERIDLVTDSAEAFYERLAHRRMAGYRLYPLFDAEVPIGETPQVRPVEDADRAWVAETLTRRWGATYVVSRGRRHDASALAGMLAEIDGERLGLATYMVDGDEVEVVTMDALFEGRGIGTALLEAVVRRAVAAGRRRLWLVTTNDNLDALRFYQRRGLRLVAVHRGAVDQARLIKPQIPEVGALGIGVHDEIELQLDLPSG
jgi:ribosomal protein S18 acetylase RimI-like enzyme